MRFGAYRPVFGPSTGAARRFVPDALLGGGPPGLASSLSDLQEDLGALFVFQGAGPLGRAVLRLGEAAFGVGELLFERAGVEVVGRDRFLDQDPRRVGEDLQPAVRLGVAFGLR